MSKNIRFIFSILALMLGCFTSVTALADGTLEKVRVYGASLEGNLEGSDPERDVFVYLPPSYSEDSDKRYPVVYFLHGYSATAQLYITSVDLPASGDAAIANGAQEMIVVLPDAFSAYSGSMYSNSLTTGDWETYVAEDLVAYIDSHYRTIANRESRGLSGHSMGGYGTVRIGMKNPEVFGVLYAMSSCCLMNGAPSLEAVEQQIERMSQGPVNPADGFVNVLQAQAAAWAPNPQNPPYYFDWPYVDGEAQPLVQAKWVANSPLVMVDQYVAALKSYHGFYLDVGDKDGLSASNIQLDEALTRLGVDHGFAIYDGDHVNRVGQRFLENLLPFFSENLEQD